MTDLDRQLAQGLGTAAEYVPPADALLPEFRHRLVRRRRRLLVERVGVLALAVAGIAVVVQGGNEVPPPPAAPSTTTTAPGFDPTDIRLPDEGVAVNVEGGVELVGLDGRVYAHLPGYVVDLGDESAGPVLLRSRSDDYLLVADNRVERVPYRPGGPVTLPLAYDADMQWTPGQSPGGPLVRRHGNAAFDARDDAPGFYFVSNDRDLVTEQTPKGTRVLDLRHGTFRDISGGCWAADRHGPRRYLVCDAQVVAGDETDPSPPRLVDRLHAVGHWRKAMVSPDGARVLLQWSGECEVQEVVLASSSTGKLTTLGTRFGVEKNPAAQAHGWTLDGRAVVTVEAGPACGEGIPVGGVYLVGDGKPVRIHSESTTAALWQPALR